VLETSGCFKCTDELNCLTEAYSYIPLNKRNKTVMVDHIACRKLMNQNLNLVLWQTEHY